MVTDLQLVEGVRGLVSLFSARQAPEPGKLPAALFPPELPQGAAYEKFARPSNPTRSFAAAAVQKDCTLALIVLSLEPERRFQQRARQGGRRHAQDHGRRSRRAAVSTPSSPAFP